MLKLHYVIDPSKPPRHPKLLPWLALDLALPPLEKVWNYSPGFSFDTELNDKLIGSGTEMPKDLLQEIRQLEEIFTVPTDKLKAITEHFISELAKGR